MNAVEGGAWVDILLFPASHASVTLAVCAATVIHTERQSLRSLVDRNYKCWRRASELASLDGGRRTGCLLGVRGPVGFELQGFPLR
jgi:hypothetical protein